MGRWGQSPSWPSPDPPPGPRVRMRGRGQGLDASLPLAIPPIQRVSWGSRKSREAVGRCLGFLSCACMSVVQSCPTLCDPMDCSPPGSSVHGILQARILGWAAIPFSRGPSRPRDRTQVSCTASRFFTCLSHQGNSLICKVNKTESPLCNPECEGPKYMP